MEDLTKQDNATSGSLRTGKKTSRFPVQIILQHNRIHISGGHKPLHGNYLSLLHTHFQDSLHSNPAPYLKGLMIVFSFQSLIQ